MGKPRVAKCANAGGMTTNSTSGHARLVRHAAARFLEVFEARRQKTAVAPARRRRIGMQSIFQDQQARAFPQPPGAACVSKSSQRAETPESLPRATAAIEAEIKQLEQRMRDRRAWFKDEKSQQRHRTLLAQRDANG